MTILRKYKNLNNTQKEVLVNKICGSFAKQELFAKTVKKYNKVNSFSITALLTCFTNDKNSRLKLF